MSTPATPAFNLLDFDEPALITWLADHGEPSYRAQQILKWVHQHGVLDFSQMSNLSKPLRQLLAQHFVAKLPEIVSDHQSADGTRKWLLKMFDGNAVEMVAIPEGTRVTLCVSSQAGCALNCSFCATAQAGFNRNLTLGEIIAQVWVAWHALAKSEGANQPLTNVVMMGMGEPLLNYDAVVSAMSLMMADYSYGLSKYRVTLSTSGVVPKMQQLKEDSPAALAVSLHAANNKLREELVPINKKYPLEVLIPLCRDYYNGHKKRVVTFEYVMLKGVNDSLQHANELIALLKDVPCKMNLIPFNPFKGSHYETSSREVIEAFQNRLVKNGVATWVRKTRGEDIAAACGQLAGEFHDRTGRKRRLAKTV